MRVFKVSDSSAEAKAECGGGEDGERPCRSGLSPKRFVRVLRIYGQSWLLSDWEAFVSM